MLIKLILKRKLRIFKRIGFDSFVKNTQKCTKLQHVLHKTKKWITQKYLTQWKEKIYLSNIIHAQRTIDKLPVMVEKNVLFDIGGELQRILEDYVHLKLTTQSTFYDEVGKHIHDEYY